MIDLAKHVNHKTEIAQIGNNIELSCITCNDVVLLTQPAPNQREQAQAPAAEVCTLDEGCTSCGS